MTNETITVEDLAGLEALPAGTEFNSTASPYSLMFRRTEAGIEMAKNTVLPDTEYTTGFIARKYLPGLITNPENLGGDFAGIGDRVEIVDARPRTYVGRFGILREVDDDASEPRIPFRVELDDRSESEGQCVWARTIKPAPLPTPPRFKIGDMVRVVREMQYEEEIVDGPGVELYDIDPYDETYPYYVENYGWVYEIAEYVEPPIPEVPLEYPVVFDQAGLDALPDNSVIVSIGGLYTKAPLTKWLGDWVKAGVPGTFNSLATDIVSFDKGAYVVHQG